MKEKQPTKTPFEVAIEQVQNGEIQAPSVSSGSKNIDYFVYQLASHKYHLSLMAKGMKGPMKLTEMKKYYGLKGRSAADCLPQFIKIMDKYTATLQPKQA